MRSECFGWFKSKIANFAPIFKKNDDTRNTIGEYMKTYPQENNLVKQPKRMLILSFNVGNGLLITPFFNVFSDLGLQCTNVHRFIQNTQHKVYDSFIQSAVDARRAADENPLSGVEAETMILLGNNSYGFQIMHRSKRTLLKYLGEEKKTKSYQNQFFKSFNIVAKDLYEVELFKSTIEHCEPIMLNLFNLQYAKLRMFYNFFYNFCEVNKFEGFEMNTDSLYLALAEDECIHSSKRAEQIEKRSKDSRDDFRAEAKNNFFPVLTALNMRNLTRENQEFRCTEMLCLCSKTYCCYNIKSQKYKFSSKGLNKGALEDPGGGLMAKYRQVLDEAVNLKSTNGGYKMIIYAVATNE